MKLAYWMYAGPAHIGTLRVACSFKNVHAIMHAPLGDDYFNVMRSMLERERDFTPVTASIVDRHVLARGSQEKVAQNITRKDKEERPDLVILTPTCTSSILQEDLQNFVNRAATSCDGDVLLADVNHYRVSELQAADRTLEQVVRFYIEKAKKEQSRKNQKLWLKTVKPSANIIGVLTLGFHNLHDARELKRLLHDLGISVNLVIPEGSAVTSLQDLPKAWFNIVPYREVGLQAALYLEKECQMPFIATTPMGIVDTATFIREIQTTITSLLSNESFCLDLDADSAQGFATRNEWLASQPSQGSSEAKASNGNSSASDLSLSTKMSGVQEQPKSQSVDKIVPNSKPKDQDEHLGRNKTLSNSTEGFNTNPRDEGKYPQVFQHLEIESPKVANDTCPNIDHEPRELPMHQESMTPPSSTVESTHSSKMITEDSLKQSSLKSKPNQQNLNLNKFMAKSLAHALSKKKIESYIDSQTRFVSQAAWFSRSIDCQNLTGKKAVVFGDATHAASITRILSREMGIRVCCAGTYCKHDADWFREHVQGFCDSVLISEDHTEVSAAITRIEPSAIFGTQMERHIGKRLGIPCGVISAPVHIQNFTLGYRPFLGYEGTNQIADLVYNSFTLGMEDHLLEIFGGHDTKETPTFGLENSSEIQWEADGLAELNKIPGFVRGKVKRNTEKYAALNKISKITVNVMFAAKEAVGA